MRKRLILLAVAVAAIVGLTAGPASASSNYYYYYGGVYRAYGEFTSYGDSFVVCDMAVDGYGSYLQFHVPSTGRYDGVYDTNGAGNSCGTYNTNIGEGRYIEYRICLTNNGSTLWSTCGGWKGDWA